MTGKWFAIEITADPMAIEAVEFLFNQLDSLGTEVQQFHKNENEPLTVIGYFDNAPDQNVFEQELESSLKLYSVSPEQIKTIRHKTIEQTDWLAEWKRHWKPTRVGRFLIAPEWAQLSGVQPDTIVIRIDPNMAFGTGTHETTQLCLRAIDENFKPGMSFLDVGTGTGILAIAAAKLNKSRRSRNDEIAQDTKPRSILALDTDPDAIEIAKHNAKRNNVSEIEFQVSTLSESIPAHDLICANVTAEAIIPLLPLLLEKTGHIAVLSGILREQEDQVRSALVRSRYREFTKSAAGDWIAIVVRAKPNSG